MSDSMCTWTTYSHVHRSELQKGVFGPPTTKHVPISVMLHVALIIFSLFSRLGKILTKNCTTTEKHFQTKSVDNGAFKDMDISK